MRLSLIQRVVLGFTVVTLFMLAISASAYYAQLRMAHQLNLTASTFTGLLDDSNSLMLHLQNANRAMMQHANTSLEEERSKLQDDFFDSKENYLQTLHGLKKDLQSYPNIQDSLSKIETNANFFLEKANAHLLIQDKRIAARINALKELGEFDDEWRFFTLDLDDMVSDAEKENDKQSAWELTYIRSQGDRAAIYLQRSLAVLEKEKIENYQIELSNYLTRFKEKVQPLVASKPPLKLYLDLLSRAIALPDGLFQQHLQYVALNEESRLYLVDIAADMGRINTVFNEQIGNIRVLSNTALLEAEQASSRSIIINLSLSFLSIIISVIVAWTVIRAIKLPLIEIMGALTRLSDGDLSYSIDDKYQSEMGLIAKNINHLKDKLSGIISKIQVTSQTINDVSNDSYVMSSQTSEDVDLQKNKTESVAAAVTEMEAAVQDVATHAADASREVSLLTDQAQVNMNNTQENLEFVNELKLSLDSATGVIKQLSEESFQIGNILSVIQSISEQTNLLALNAAIEAARAGEQGRGFAVVADEVRTLATRTKDSSNEISAMIKSLQAKAEQAVTIVESNLQHADQSVNKTQETNYSLQEMVQRLEKINDMSHSIATASEQQSGVAKEVAQNIVSISDVAENISSIAEQSAKNSSSLKELASEQSELVAQFKL